MSELCSAIYPVKRSGKMLVFSVVVLLLAGVVMGNSYFEARREVTIEGRFGWSALTFTRRYRSDSLSARLAMIFVGPEKVPTEYHVDSAALWLLMYLSALPIAMLYGVLTGGVDLGTMANVFTLIVACWVLTMNAEDYLWFMIHPYYGPSRFSAEYIPWIQSYKLGLQSSYLWSVGLATVLVVVVAAVTGLYLAAALWLCVLVLVVLACAGIRRNAKIMPRKELLPRWWESMQIIVIERSAYPIEARPYNLEAVAWVLDPETLAQLIAAGKATKLE